MHGLKIFEYHTWQPLSYFGIYHPFFVLHADTIIYTWVALCIIFIIACIGRWSLHYPQSTIGYLSQSFVRIFIDTIEQSFNRFIYPYFFFITALFSFILICNLLLLLPGGEEPTKDINTTLALGIISFLYTQKEGFKALGFAGYVQEYMKFPFSFISPHARFSPIVQILLNILIFCANCIVGIITLPLEVFGKLATIISLAFRLFGNIFGGSMIYGLWLQAISGSIIWQALAIITGINLIIMLFFGLFESLIQAFVFSILSLTYLSMAVQHGEITEETFHE
jgi:F-type H+-transporting ATPase subunit a